MTGTPGEGVTGGGLGTACRILVVDDDLDHRESAADILRLAGHEVLTAASGFEALERVAAGFHPRVVVLDLLMPGMDGATLRTKLDELPPDLRPRRIVVTGVCSPHVKRLLAPDGVLFKPYSPHDLLDAVARACGAGAGQAQDR
jgi:CheY-like chemotaxis protein